MLITKAINVLIVLAVLLMPSNRVYGKTTEDELITILNKAEDLRVINLNKAIEYLEPKKQLFLDNGSLIGLAEYNLYLSFYYMAIGKLDISEALLAKVTEIVDNNDLPEQKADEIFFRGMLAQRKAEIEKGIQLFLQQYEFAKQHNLVTNQIYSKIHLNQLFASQGDNLSALTHLKDAYRLLPEVKPQRWKRTVALKALVTSSMARIYNNMGEPHEAVEFSQEAIEGFKQFNSLIDAGVVNVRLASIYMNNLNDYDSASREFEKVYQLAKEIENDKLLILYYQGIGRLFLKTERLQRAQDSFNSAISLSEKNSWDNYKKTSQFDMAQVYIQLEQWQQAEKLLLEVEPYYKKFQLFAKSYDVHNELQLIYFKLNKLEQAYYHQTTAIEYYKINQNAEANKALAKVRTELDLQLNEVRNQLLEKENEVANLNLAKQKVELDSQNQMLYFLMIVVTLLLFITVGLFLFSRRLRYQAITDSMTKLPNRRRVFEFGEREFSKAQKKREAFSVAIFDLDRFKKVNDTFGHEIGDRVIIQVSDICNSLAENSNLVGRLGGEEFILIMPGYDLERAISLAEAMRKGIEDFNWQSIHPMLSITSSFGVTCLTDGKKDLDELIRLSDDALYQAKEQGRNKVLQAA